MAPPTITWASAEMMLWLLAGLVWLAIQGLQRSLRNKNQTTTPEPDISAPPGGAGNRDLDDFLSEIFERAAPAPAPPPEPAPLSHRTDMPPRHPLTGSTTPAPPTNRRSAPPALRPLPAPHPKPAKPAAFPRPAVAGLPTGAAARVFQTGTFMRNAALPVMPAMQPRPNSTRQAHPMAAALKTGTGIRRAILWREVIGQSRALHPY